MLARVVKTSDHAVAEPLLDAPSVTSRVQEHTPAPPRSVASPSLISAALSVVGKMESAGDIQVEGKLEGEIRGRAVRIGASANIKGSVVGEIVELAGTLEGKIEAGSVILARTAHVDGDIAYGSLQIEQGAYFNGNSRPVKKETH